MATAAVLPEPAIGLTPHVPSPADKPAFDAAIVDADSYAHEERYHAIFKYLREEAPVYWCEPEGYRPFWTVARHADIRRVELDNETFLNDPRLTLATIADEERIMALTGGNKLTRNLVSMDNPDHKHFRAMTQGYFSPKYMKQLEADIRVLAKESVEHMASLGSQCDFAAEVAIWFPLRVIMLTLGAPREDEQFLMKITQEVFGAQDFDHMRPEEMGGLFATIAEFNAWCDRITADRKANPREDVSTIIANATLTDGSPMGNMEAMSYYLIIAAAGHDTTSSSSSAGLLELIRNPGEMRKLRNDPALLPNAIEEMIRWASPVKHFFRTAAKDAEVGGVPIKAGDNLVMAYPSANRDTAVFDDPFAFRIDRANVRQHLAFGYGPHLCLGQHLAKLEMRILFEELLARFDHFELAGDPSWTRASFVSGMKHLPIRYQVK
ncbi:cytochrome P450 [Sphingomonas jeddahensis]|uniref:Cytochrome P450-terp n=1 Tax=Sphingomonas jeddahensis TaxID=1915074 RepID=A0A1V2ESZ5_9SPHN|nr:cytochrome P450 [Sphingomonas jeddahensis]ONF95617.1 Cytochrome P450-terp [Sphingomonas jeddahensis]